MVTKKAAVPKRAPAKKAEPKLPSFIINKTPSGLTKVSVNEFKGKLSIDVRHYYRDKDSGEYKPTPKGTSVPLNMGRKFYIRMKKLVLEAEAAGMVVTDEAEY